MILVVKESIIVAMFKYKKDNPNSYALGTTLAFELLKHRPEMARRLYISPLQKRDATYAEIVRLAKTNRVPVIENNEKIFRELSDKDNVMVIAEFEKFFDKLDGEANHVVLVNPSNLGNMGTIIRAMAGFNFLNLAIIKPACDPFDPKAIRASMGAIFDMHVEMFDSYEAYQTAYNKQYPYPFMLQATKELKNADKRYPCALVFGNEATGLNRSFLELGEPLIIPHSPLIDSLNLDNAVSIALYEFSK